MSSNMILAKGYISITDRGEQVEDVRRELNAVVNALPTQIHPGERESLIDVLLSDLEDREGAPWTFWPSDVYLLCLTALKTLGRNPMGSQNLLQSANLQKLLFHTALPFTTSSSLSSYLPPGISSPQALEALRVLANLLVLHPAGRSRFAKAGGGEAIARGMAERDRNGKPLFHTGEEEDNTDRLFLLARIGFLVTMERKDVVEVMVDKEDIIDSLVHYLSITPLIPTNFNALSELLKLINNIIRFYPFPLASDEWDGKFDPLLWPTLALFHSLPFTDYTPPLTHCLHVLLAIPFIPRLLYTWHSTPEDNTSPDSGVTIKGLFGRLSNIALGSETSSSTNKSPENPTSNNKTRSRTPSPTVPSVNHKRTTVLPAKKEDTMAFVNKVIKILERYLDQRLPWPKKPDDQLEHGLVIDEHLPPIFLLLSRAAEGSEPTRKYLKNLLVPDDLDRSPEAGPLEDRKGLLGTLLRFMACMNHPQSKSTAGELLWAVCDQDASTFSAEIGYGNAAGLLFQKGLSGPPPGKIQEISTPSSAAGQTSSSTSHQTPRNPITALQPPTRVEADPTTQWTDEEKEREAERLFAVFDKMDRNPVISAQGADGGKKGVKEAIQEKYLEVDKDWGERERKEREEEERRDEEDVKREMEAYRRRVGKM